MTTATKQMSDYDEAIFYASYDFCMWKQQHERVQRRYEKGDGDTGFVRLMERDEAIYAAATQAQQQLIGYLFGKSEEEIHADLMLEYEEHHAAGIWK